MPEQTYDEQDLRALILAARDAAEELYVITKMGTRRSAPAERWRRLVDALKPFAATDGAPDLPSQR